MKKIDFRYSNSAIVDWLWLLFGLAGGLFFLLISPVQSYLSLWLVKEFKVVGLILAIIFVLAEGTLLMFGSYYLSLTINDKRGTALFSNDYVKITMGSKETTINYMKITDIKCSEIVNGTRRSGYKLELKAKGINLKIRSSLKELWENRIRELKRNFSIIRLLNISMLNDYHTTFEDIYNEIELQIALNHEPE